MENFKYGYRYEPVPHEPEQKVIRYIRKLAETLTQREIAQRLNDEGVTFRGRKWHQASISRILQRESGP